MKIRHSLAIVALSVLLPLTAAQADLEEIRQEAQKGDPRIQYDLGILYEFGFHLSDNQVYALAWYSIAADRGNVRAAQRRDILRSQLTTAQQDRAVTLIAELTTNMPPPPAPKPVAPAPAAPEPPEAAPAPEAPDAATPEPEPAEEDN